MTDRDVHEAFSRIIQDRRFAEAAKTVSRIMRARKRSPLQEAGGERLCQHNLSAVMSRKTPIIFTCHSAPAPGFPWQRVCRGPASTFGIV